MQTSSTIKKSSLAPTILIAGGAGFIGSHLAEVLLQKEARVIVLDNFRTGKQIHVNHLLTNPKFALYDVDINEGLPQDIESVDYIFHIAGLEEYLFSKDTVDLDSLLTNALGTKNLLDLANRSEAKFLLASTIDVYEGKMSQLSIDSYFGKTGFEEKKYGMAEAKRYAEALVFEYHKKHNTNVRIVRLPEVYGPRMSFDASGSLGKLFRDLVEGRPFVIKGDGAKKEYYLYINDAVSGMIKALLNDGTTGGIYSLVPNDSMSLIETTYLIRSLADRRVEIKFEDEGATSEVKEFKPDTYNLIYLKWEPKVSLKDGIVTTLNWFGYQVNEHAFKNAKLIDKLTDPSKQTPALPVYQSFAFQKQAPQEQQSSYQENYNQRKITNLKEIPKIKRNKIAFHLPRLNLGKFSIVLPKISLASKFSVFVIVVLSFLSVFVILPGYQTYSSAKRAMSDLEEVPEMITRFDSKGAAVKADNAHKEFLNAKKYFSSLDWIYKLFGKYDDYKSTSKFINSVSYFSSVAADLSMSISPLSDIWDSLKPDSTKQFDPKTLEDSKLYLSDAKNNLQLAIAEFNEVDSNYLPALMKDAVEPYSEVLKTSTEGLELANSVMGDLPSLIGFETPKKYLVLFQNNNEIRPTGGFIGSYAFLSLKDGKIQELSIDDIYNPDGQLDVRNIKVITPEPIGKFLTEDRLYIRNANWDPDFPRSAETIRDLFFRLNGETIDGVIALDLNVAAAMLKITGPIFLTAYNEEINVDNLYERTQFHSSYNFESGSQQKRQFLTVFGSKLLESLFALEKEKTQVLGMALSEVLQERHLQVHLFSSPIEAVLMDKGWNGSLKKTEGDYLQVVNANLGGTKANYYVKEDMAYKVMSLTRDGLLRAELALNYEHTGTDSAWPGGPYTNYLRVLAQKGAKLTGAKIIYNSALENDIFNEVVIANVEPYTSFETNFKLEPGNSAKVVLYYDLPQNLSITKEQTKYSLLWQKQAGTHQDAYSYSFGIPFGMNFIDGAEFLKSSENTIFTSGELKGDLELFVMLE